MRRPLKSAAVVSLVLLLGACPPGGDDDDSASQGPADAGALDAGALDAGVTDAAPAADASQPPDAAIPAWLAPPGAETTQELCTDSQDNDQNGYADCDDYWCRDSVAVTACNSLENTAAACTDGVDNPESPGNPNSTKLDGLVDCADPDCAKNPYLTVCPPLRWETGTAACSNHVDDDGDGLVDCEDPDCLHAGMSACPLNGTRRILFDDAHRERAGSADWVLDVPGPHPWPSVPQHETDWAGQLSSFAMELVQTGHFTVETVRSNGKLTFGDVTEAQDLMNFAALVLPEPSANLAPEEADAVVAFLRAGGGVLMVADHLESDRDGNHWDSVQVFNDLLTRAGNGDLAANPLGFSAALVTYAESGSIENLNHGVASTIPAEAASHPVLSGPHGTVTRLGMHKGGLFTLHPDVNAHAQTLVHAMALGTAGYEQGSPYVIVTQLDQGRVVAVGDSAILNDGTDSHGIQDAPFDSWHQADQQNAALFLNALEWLAP